MSKRKKNVYLPFTLFTFLSILSSCGKTPDVSISEKEGNTKQEYINDKVNMTTALADVTIENTFLSAKFNLDNGSLFSLVNKKSGTDYLNDSVGGLWSMTVDVSTKNPFLTNYTGENAIRLSSRDYMVDFSSDESENGIKLTFTYNVDFSFLSKNYSGIIVKSEVSLLKGTEELQFDYELTNSSTSDITICSFIGTELSGLKDSKDKPLSLLWSNKEGKIYDNVISDFMSTNNTDKNLKNVYPGTLSMQFASLFNESESLFTFVKDDTAEYKIARFGDYSGVGEYDYNKVSKKDKLSMSFEQFPFVGSGSKKTIHPVVVGISYNQSWYQGADKYQQYLKDNNMLNNYEKFPENWNGFISLVGSHYGPKHFSSYITSEVGEISYADWVNQADENSGVDTELILGWNKGGFDSMYPDYEFQEGTGFNGEEGFLQMSNLVHENGDLFACHMNSRLADIQGNWSNTLTSNNIKNINNSAIKKAGFKSTIEEKDYEKYIYCETYGTGTMYYVMSPASKEFQEQLFSVVRRLRKNGCNGLWFDQLFEKDGHLDYDEGHKMSSNSTPATLYGEGYLKILKTFKDIALEINPQEPWLTICSGGAGDCFARYCDVYGGNWNRKLGARDNSQDDTIDKSSTESNDRHQMSPEVTKYTIPSVYIGQAGAGTLSGQNDEYARAFIFGSPFLAEQFTTSTQQLINIYDFYPDIFYKGTYKDKKALTYTNDDLLASVILSSSSKSFAIQLYNYSENEANNVSIKISLSKLNIEGQIESIIDLFSGKKVSVENDVITISLDACEFTSLYVKYK